jgi:hemolysin activation/secretion protein
LEAAAGWSGGALPVQSLWYLGGPGSLRGYDGATVGGESFWRGRAEIGAGIPGARLALFSDAGWAGSRDAFTTDPSLIGAGVGASFMDGLIRVDLARALRRPTGWRLDFYLNGLI